MTQIEWKISNKEAIIESARPARGVQYEDAHLLGVCLPGLAESTSKAILEQFKQEDRLTVRYAGNESWPVWSEVRWQIFETRDRPGLNVDLDISVRTGQPICEPELIVQSDLPGSESFIVRVPGEEATPLALDTPHLLTRVNSTGCVLLRPQGQDWSLVEMVHPVDFIKDELKYNSDLGRNHLRHHLFMQSLEKGVLLRARLRAIIIDRTEDLETAATLYTEFIEEPPVL